MNTIIYNGKTFIQIVRNLHPEMIKQHKREYLNRCLEVYSNEKTGYNLDHNQALRNANFILTSFYYINYGPTINN
jgi:hypothetical protein